MSAHDNGGPAFPCKWDYIGTSRAAANGMTLRDYFAAKAMQGALANRSEFKLKNDEDLAKRCYATADAMLKARQS